MADDLDVQKEIGKLTDNVKKTTDDLNSTFNDFKKTQEDAQKDMATKGYVDPLLEEMRTKMADGMVKMQEAVDTVTAKMNAPKFGTDSYSEKDAEFRNARKFYTDMAIKRKRLDAGQSLTDDQIDVKAYGEYKKALSIHMRKTDVRALDGDVLKALSVGTDPDGGYTVPVERSNRVIERQFESSPLRQMATIETISGGSLEIMEDIEEFSVNRTGERTSQGETATAQLGLREITPQIIESRPRATQNLIDDSSIDIEAWIDKKNAAKFNRVEASEWIGGDGVGKGRGIVTYPAGADWKTIEQINSGANGSVTYAALADISVSLKEGYYANAKWLLYRALIGKILGLTGNDSPLWIPSIAVGQPSTLLGYPVHFAQDLATLATGSLSGVFGDFKAGYTWVDRLGIRIQPDPYTVKPFIEYYTTKRSSGDVTDFDAMKIIKLSA